MFRPYGTMLEDECLDLGLVRLMQEGQLKLVQELSIGDCGRSFVYVELVWNWIL